MGFLSDLGLFLYFKMQLRALIQLLQSTDDPLHKTGKI